VFFHLPQLDLPLTCSRIVVSGRTVHRVQLRPVRSRQHYSRQHCASHRRRPGPCGTAGVAFRWLHGRWSLSPTAARKSLCSLQPEVGLHRLRCLFPRWLCTMWCCTYYERYDCRSYHRWNRWQWVVHGISHSALPEHLFKRETHILEPQRTGMGCWYRYRAHLRRPV
jgi:hypothetical protein